MDTVVNCRIVLETPPPGVDYALQKGRGSTSETVQTQRSDGSNLRFEFTAGARTAGSSPDFRGPFIQGPAGGRFVYIGIGTFAGQTGTPWSRRLKIPLKGITSEMIRRASATQGAVLEARVEGTGRDGSPACASVKDFDGWHLRLAR
jgi:Family of unknown function (DUF5990)